MQFGGPLITDRTKGYDFSLFARFKDRAALDTYAANDEHRCRRYLALIRLLDMMLRQKPSTMILRFQTMHGETFVGAKLQTAIRISFYIQQPEAGDQNKCMQTAKTPGLNRLALTHYSPGFRPRMQTEPWHGIPTSNTYRLRALLCGLLRSRRKRLLGGQVKVTFEPGRKSPTDSYHYW
ncbi:Dabb domain-containing protein [Rhizoctonia solani AG-1 IA]|uniref:Dabb domain-containing protein n=1 Tax=Thanatephorus cucumeris (strain AG1-IA) TaxID=983506 RepID=L8WQR2_THACA|nr:Dabb domain-containing protein [Rhizoctonia solani AG-1 IA]